MGAADIARSTHTFLQSLQQFFSFFLIARLSKKCKHVFLVALNARLVERIDTQYVAAHAACKLEEVEQLTKIELILLRDLYHQVRYISIRMCKDCSVHCALIYEINGLACQIVQAVQIYRLLVYGQLTLRLLYIQNRLKQDACCRPG